MAIKGVWGIEVPQPGPGAEPSGIWGLRPQNQEITVEIRPEKQTKIHK